MSQLSPATFSPAKIRDNWDNCPTLAKLTLAVAISGATAGNTLAQDYGYGQGLRPVPKAVSQVAPATPHNATRDGWNLQWRQSQAVAPEQVRYAPTSTANGQPVQQVSGLRAVDAAPHFQSVSQSAYMTQPTRASDLLARSPSDQPQASNPNIRVAQGTSDNDFFSNPFGDGSVSNSTTMTMPAPPSIADDPIDDGFLAPPPNTTPPNTTPPAAKPNNLRDAFGMPDERTPPPAQPAPKMNEPSLRDMLRRETPEQSPSDIDAQELPAPKNLDRSNDDLFDNPFPVREKDERNADAEDRDLLNDPRDGADNGFKDNGFKDDDEFKAPAGISCDTFRDRIAFQTIDKVSLDISPPYRPDEFDQKRYERLKSEFDEKQVIRQWRNISGTPLASGRLKDLAYEKAIIETDFGTTEELPVNSLSEADLAYISDNWGLPSECLIEQVAFAPRTWTPMTMTYKASNLCHSPLYFEDVNLERYGHTRGPVLEPIVQTAHFFGNIAVLPYKMGVHGPNECIYSLGYYRPGSCAPWIKPPVPISARGALYQTAAVTGLFWLIP